MLLTKESGILKPFASIIGYLIEGIYWVLDKIGIPNIGLSIILLTIVIYLLMLPLTYKQQKFSKLSAKMNPELQAITAKYKGKTDQESVMRMQAEQKIVYEKYGVSPTGSCLQLLIQMPILFALYRVIYSIPAYITSVGNIFRELSSRIIDADNGDYLINCEIESIANTVKSYGKNISDDNLSNGIIDVLNRLTTADLNTVAEHYGISDLTYMHHGVNERILSVLDSSFHVTEAGLLDKINTFLGLNISNSPSYTIKNELALGADKSWLVILGVILIPVLSALTQFINVKLMPQAAAPSNEKPGEENPMMQSMKTMNTVMPLFSAFMCYTLPVGIGIYWIAGSIIRTIIQVILNKKIDKIDIEEMIKKNIENNNKKRERQGLPPQTVNNFATMNTKNVDRNVEENKNKKIQDSHNYVSSKDSSSYYNNQNAYKKGSLASKAFMVKSYNESNDNKANNNKADDNKSDDKAN